MTLLKNWLEKKTYEVKYTGSQQDVAEIIKKFRPELVIVDVLQTEVVKQLKISEETRSVPVISMTGYTSRQKMTACPLMILLKSHLTFLYRKRK